MGMEFLPLKMAAQPIQRRSIPESAAVKSPMGTAMRMRSWIAMIIAAMIRIHLKLMVMGTALGTPVIIAPVFGIQTKQMGMEMAQGTLVSLSNG
jgi:hypothetical protein